ncbi:hypothetical protein T01_2328 [Trichinella spiralis]|uniref:Uncharacterized protein n=1 Tax=Trichinella spiralis TaxID=6334 RepID=A0A0V1AZ86_TRISP|nr:hypothetical protein T01_2328 [Trichinella spiralis]
MRMGEAVEVQIRATRLTPSRPGNIWITTPRGQHVQEWLSSINNTVSLIPGPNPSFLHLQRGSSVAT